MKTLGRALFFSLALATSLPALAQDPPATDPGEDRAATFVAVDGAVTEDVPGGPLLVGAYGAVLVLLVGYVLWLAALQSGATREIARLAAAIEKHEKRPVAAKSEKKKSDDGEPTAKASSDEKSGAAADEA